jgi:hypothetical protein
VFQVLPDSPEAVAAFFLKPQHGSTVGSVVSFFLILVICVSIDCDIFHNLGMHLIPRPQ